MLASVNWPRVLSVSALLVNAKGQLLLQLRDDKPSLRHGNHWATFGGAVDPGETLGAALNRELREEITLERVPPLQLWKVYTQAHYRNATYSLLDIFVYVGRFDCDPAALEIHEGQRAAYFGLEDLDLIPIAFGFEMMFREFFAEQALFLGVHNTDTNYSGSTG
jgi:8-oxo-dGTP diphosphatase